MEGKVINMKKLILRILTIVCLIIIIGLIIYMSFLFSFGVKHNQRKIIKKYNKNIYGFQQSMHELLNNGSSSQMYFENEYVNIKAYYFYCQDGQCKTIYLSSKEKKKYKNTMSLIKKLNLEKVSYSRGNIDYLFHSSMAAAQSMVYMSDSDKYESEGHIIKKSKNIKEKWYYVETS